MPEARFKRRTSGLGKSSSRIAASGHDDPMPILLTVQFRGTSQK